MPTEKVLTDSEVDAAWGREHYTFSGVERASEWYRDFARRIESAVSDKWLERLRVASQAECLCGLQPTPKIHICAACRTLARMESDSQVEST